MGSEIRTQGQAENEFEQELEIFRREAEACTQFLYSWLTVHATMNEHRKVSDSLNEASLFWATVLGALQLSTFIVLGRIFDKGRSTHNINRLLRLAQDNPQMFSKGALASRKERASANASEWLSDYLRSKQALTARDVRRLRGYVRKWRKVYEAAYHPLRNQVFAHTEIRTVSAELFAKTNIREMQKMLLFLRQLHETLWELFNNGFRPILRPQSYSVRSIRAKRSHNGFSRNVQETIVKEAESFLLAAAGLPKAHSANSKPGVTHCE